MSKRDNIKVIDINTENGLAHLIAVNNNIYVLSDNNNDVIQEQIDLLSNELLTNSETVNIIKYDFNEQETIYKDNIDKILQHEVDILTNEMNIDCDIDKLKDAYLDSLEYFENDSVFVQIDDTDLHKLFVNSFNETLPKADVI